MYGVKPATVKMDIARHKIFTARAHFGAEPELRARACRYDKRRDNNRWVRGWPVAVTFTGWGAAVAV